MRGVVGELGKARPDDVTILDTEASIEHMTRGTVRNSDAILLVTEPYYRSLETTGRIVPLARDLGLQRVWVVANKVRSERDGAAIREYCERRGFDILGVVPFDEGIAEADRQGRSLVDYMPTAGAVLAIEQLADTLVERLGVRVPVGR